MVGSSNLGGTGIHAFVDYTQQTNSGMRLPAKALKNLDAADKNSMSNLLKQVKDGNLESFTPQNFKELTGLFNKALGSGASAVSAKDAYAMAGMMVDLFEDNQLHSSNKKGLQLQEQFFKFLSSENSNFKNHIQVDKQKAAELLKSPVSNITEERALRLELASEQMQTYAGLNKDAINQELKDLSTGKQIKTNHLNNLLKLTGLSKDADQKTIVNNLLKRMPGLKLQIAEVKGSKVTKAMALESEAASFAGQNGTSPSTHTHDPTAGWLKLPGASVEQGAKDSSKAEANSTEYGFSDQVQVQDGKFVDQKPSDAQAKSNNSDSTQSSDEKYVVVYPDGTTSKEATDAERSLTPNLRRSQSEATAAKTDESDSQSQASSSNSNNSKTNTTVDGEPATVVKTIETPKYPNAKQVPTSEGDMSIKAFEDRVKADVQARKTPFPKDSAEQKLLNSLNQANSPERALMHRLTRYTGGAPVDHLAVMNPRNPNQVKQDGKSGEIYRAVHVLSANETNNIEKMMQEFGAKNTDELERILAQSDGFKDYNIVFENIGGQKRAVLLHNDATPEQMRAALNNIYQNNPNVRLSNTPNPGQVITRQPAAYPYATNPGYNYNPYGTQVNSGYNHNPYGTQVPVVTTPPYNPNAAHPASYPSPYNTPTHYPTVPSHTHGPYYGGPHHHHPPTTVHTSTILFTALNVANLIKAIKGQPHYVSHTYGGGHHHGGYGHHHAGGYGHYGGYNTNIYNPFGHKNDGFKQYTDYVLERRIQSFKN